MEQEQTKNESKRERATQIARMQKIKKIFWIAVVAVLIGIGVWGIITYRRYQDAHLPGVTYPEQKKEHVDENYQFSYNSNPPTSGPHFAQPSEWGIYKEELKDGALIHDLEHGGIWISYKPGIQDDIKKKLEGFYDTYGRKIVVTPRAANDTDIAVAAWGHLDAFSVSEYSEMRIDRFIRAFRNKGPEYVP